MRRTTPADRQAVRYLLGQLPAKERERLEQRYFEDDKLFEELCAAETALLRAYLAGELLWRERRLVESRYLKSPARRERLESVRDLFQVGAGLPGTGEARCPKPRWLSRLGAAVPVRPILAVGVLAALALVIWVGHDLPALRAQLDQVQRGRADLERRLASSDRRAEPVFSFVLAPGLTRSQGLAAAIAIPGSARLVRLELEVPPAGIRSRYRASIRMPEGAVVWSGEASIGVGGTALLNVPAAALPAGDYVVALHGEAAAGFEDVENYVFRVLRH